MDLDLADYDQVDEAKYFINQKNQTSTGDALTSFSSEQGKCDDSFNCENDFVFLPSPTMAPSSSYHHHRPTIVTLSMASQKKPTSISDQHLTTSGRQQTTVTVDIRQQPRAIITPEQLDIRSHQPMDVARFNSETLIAKRIEQVGSQPRVAHPLMTIHTNGGNNPFHGLQQTGIDDSNTIALSAQSSQPFWMRHENFSSKPIGPLEVHKLTPTTQNANHLSELMQQIVTKSDSIYIAIPCSLCHELKACPPSDISVWLNHMNRTHNCKVCPICNRLIGLGPLRDIEIMRKHVVSHIDNDWLESKHIKTNFSYGLQNHWFPSSQCAVKDPRSFPKYK